MAASKSVTTHEDIPLFAMYHSTNSSTITGPARRKKHWKKWMKCLDFSGQEFF